MPGGKHIGGYKYRNKMQNINPGEEHIASKKADSSVLSSVINAVMGALINDLNKPDSKIKQLVNRIFKRDKKVLKLKDGNKEIIDVKYKSIERRNENG